MLQVRLNCRNRLQNQIKHLATNTCIYYEKGVLNISICHKFIVYLGIWCPFSFNHPSILCEVRADFATERGSCTSNVIAMRIHGIVSQSHIFNKYSFVAAVPAASLAIIINKTIQRKTNLPGTCSAITAHHRVFNPVKRVH